ncbi:MAG TPA: dienelactone hydrolase family protein, partial [Planctomycetaceae bacterium]
MTRHRLCFGLALLMALATRADAQDDPAKQRLEKSPRHHEWVEVPAADGRKVRSFLVYPEVDRPATAVVVIHENRGLTDWVRSVADQLAEKGFVAIAPDLLSGTGPNGGGTEAFASQDEARTGISRLSPEQVTSDLDAVVKYVRDLEATNEKVAVAGFCWGGGQAFRYAAHNPEIAGAFVFYGSAPSDEELKKIEVPVYGFYGGNDFRITGQVPKVAETMKSAGKRYEPVTYEGAGHGFMRSGEDPNTDPANRKGMR